MMEGPSLGITGCLKQDGVIKRRARAVNYFDEKLLSRLGNENRSPKAEMNEREGPYDHDHHDSEPSAIECQSK